ncbi:hypothetical protein ACFPAF_21040 [Hymenobacter endophyticus]|uniref:Uncharacterized protein n=1 Tax=Hymenobacter endophyticus TaxID=3076335 RepID=A0ABU3TNJ3_9BACT|nr:hypothetical protein [Hymenobacter endophyticus]MDU0372897.1 hypothetical protein [Hymenobacter endophyticus]
MLQPKNLLMKRGTLLGKEPRVDRKVFAASGFSDFASRISVVFSEYCPSTVSEAETVFLCPLGSLATVAQSAHSSSATGASLCSMGARTLPELWLLQRLGWHRQVIFPSSGGACNTPNSSF